MANILSKFCSVNTTRLLKYVRSLLDIIHASVNNALNMFKVLPFILSIMLKSGRTYFNDVQRTFGYTSKLHVSGLITFC